MKTFKYIIALSVLTAATISCSEDFLDIQPTGVNVENNYYKDEAQAYAGVVAVYDVLKKQSSGFENMIAMLNAGSDDFYAGGGGATDGTGLQNFANNALTPATIPRSFWNDQYQGVARANLLLTKLPNTVMDETKKARFTAETKALRAFYYFELVRTFRNIPLILKPVPASEIYNVEQSTPELVYEQIEKDLTEAIPDLPSTINKTTEAGRFGKGAAQALLGKVYLYEGKNALAAAQLQEVNGTPGGTSQYGYHLISNFADLWVISNKFNTESILEVNHTSSANVDWGQWGSGTDEGNSLAQMVGPRGYLKKTDAAPDYAGGWAFNVITEDLYANLKTDPRFSATIADLKALKAAGSADYEAAYKDTGYFLKKFLPLKSDRTTGGGATELNYAQNTYVIRLADTYLLEAEALGGTGARAQALLDAVRARVGLPSIPVTLEAIAQERRLELAGEGHRWFDLVRTGKAGTVLASKGFVVGKSEIWPIPLQELNNTKMVQNPNY